MRCGIIGGTGIYDPSLLKQVKTVTVDTPYGGVEVQEGKYNSVDVVFMPRHGVGHSIPPHAINYRANIWAMKALGVERILSTNAVGSVNRTMRPGDLVIIDQFLDFTKSRAFTFFDGTDNPVVHTDVTDPYCPQLRAALIEQAGGVDSTTHLRGCYVCFEGPRYETAAEIRMTAILGGDVAGMTNVPEVILAREAGICYATACMVTNMGAGIAENRLSHDEVTEIMQANIEQVKQLLFQTIESLPPECECECGEGTVPLKGLS